ncbi:MAG: DUF427 domain-containing protein [Nonlabens sp.]
MPHKKEDRLKKTRDSWSNRGGDRPPFAIEPQEGQRSVWDFPRPPIIEEVDKIVVVKHLDEIIVDSSNTLAVLETASPPTYYLPREDINMDLLIIMPGKSSFCEWKGAATYWSLKVDTVKPIAWSYFDPFKEFADLKDYLAFYPQHLECYVGEDRVEPQPGQFYAGWITPDLTGPYKGAPETGHW